MFQNCLAFKAILTIFKLLADSIYLCWSHIIYHGQIQDTLTKHSIESKFTCLQAIKTICFTFLDAVRKHEIFGAKKTTVYCLQKAPSHRIAIFTRFHRALNTRTI